MNNWNHQNKRFVYFHVVTSEMSRNRQDFYLKVDTIEKRVWKVCEKSHRAYGKYTMGGIYELKWSTWISVFAHYLSQKSVDFIKQCEKDGNKRTRVKYTTENQFNNALIAVLENLTNIKNFVNFAL